MEFLVLVILEKCCPDENISDLDMLDNTLCVCLSGAYGTQNTSLVVDRLRRQCRRILLTDSIECVFQLWCSLFDILNNIRIVVVENMGGSEFLDQIKVSRTASGDDVETIH